MRFGLIGRRRQHSKRVPRGRGFALRGAILIMAAVAVGCGPTPTRVAQNYLANLQQFNYPACYAALTDEDQAARTIPQFATAIPLAPDVDPLWFRPILLDMHYEIEVEHRHGDRATVTIRVTMPDLALWERTIDASASEDTASAAAQQSLDSGRYPKIGFDDDLVMVKEHHRWRIVADFARRVEIDKGHAGALALYHRQDYAGAIRAYQGIISALSTEAFSGSRGIAFQYGRELGFVEGAAAQAGRSRVYVSRIVLSDVRVAMSANRTPAMFGRIINAGDRAIDDLQLTVTYYKKRRALDAENHTVVVTPLSFTSFDRLVRPFIPGETRSFAFELTAPSQIQQEASPNLTVGLISFTQSHAPWPQVTTADAPAQSSTPASPVPTPFAPGHHRHLTH